MKKILSMLLALIMCLGVFISCGDETESSSESSSNEESSNVSNEIAVEEIHSYYQELDALSGGDGSIDTFGEFYTLIRTHEEFLQAKINYGVEHIPFYETKENYLDNSFFEENYLIEVSRMSQSGTRITDIIGIRDAYVENGVLYLYKDEAKFETSYYTDAHSLAYRYFVIPKSELNLDNVTITDIKVNETIIPFIDEFVCNVSSDTTLEHGERFLITNQEEYDALKVRFGIDSTLTLQENSVYVAIYYTAKNRKASIGYHLEAADNKISLTEYTLTDSENLSEQATPCLQIVKIKLTHLDFTPSNDTEIIVQEKKCSQKLSVVIEKSE